MGGHVVRADYGNQVLNVACTGGIANWPRCLVAYAIAGHSALPAAAQEKADSFITAALQASSIHDRRPLLEREIEGPVRRRSLRGS